MTLLQIRGTLCSLRGFDSVARLTTNRSNLCKALLLCSCIRIDKWSHKYGHTTAPIWPVVQVLHCSILVLRTTAWTYKLSVMHGTDPALNIMDLNCCSYFGPLAPSSRPEESRKTQAVSRSTRTNWKQRPISSRVKWSGSERCNGSKITEDYKFFLFW